MEKINRFLSGEVPGGFFLYLTIIGILLFFRWYMIRHSPVVNNRKLSIVIFTLVGFIFISFLVARFARPPRPNSLYIGILPFENENTVADSAFSSTIKMYSGTGWALAETASRFSESASPSHLYFLRPDWLVNSYDNDSLGKVSVFDEKHLLDWATLIKLKYVAAGTFKVTQNSVDFSVIIYETATRKPIRQIPMSVPLVTGKELSERVTQLSLQLTRTLYQLTDEKLNESRIDIGYSQTSGLLDYSRGRKLLAQKLIDSSLSSFQAALQADSSNPLTWYGMGLVHGELMIRTKDSKRFQQLQNRTEYYLKMAGQINDKFQPSVSTLAKYYMFFKPEPRYLDAEIALIGANELYDRDYTVYYVLSYMQKLRWESFGMSTKEEVLKKAITVNPAGFDSYINLGKSFLELSKAHDYRAKQAMEYYSIAQQLRPADFEAIIGMVTACDYIGLYDRALKLLEFAEKLYPAKADVYYNLGVVNYHIGNSYKPKKKQKEEREQYTIAEAYFKKAIQLKPTHGYAYLYLAKIYAEFKNNEQAIESLRMVMKLLDREDRYREEARRKLNEFFPDVEG